MQICLVGSEPGAFHSAACFGTLHKGIPDKPSPGVLCHQHRDSRINSNEAPIVPVLQRIKGIDETVLAPSRGIPALNVAQNTHGRLRQEGQGTCGGAGHDCAIKRAHRGWPSPYHIAVLRVRGGDTPEIVTVARELPGQFQAETTMHIGGDHRVLKIVGVLVSLTPKIEPSLGILVYEERSERAYVAKAVIFKIGRASC